MNYKLKFLSTALKEWKKLDNSIQSQFKKKLKKGSETRMNQAVNCQDLKITTKSN